MSAVGKGTALRPVLSMSSKEVEPLWPEPVIGCGHGDPKHCVWRPQTLCVMPLLCAAMFGQGRDFTAAPCCVWKPKREC